MMLLTFDASPERGRVGVEQEVMLYGIFRRARNSQDVKL